MNDRFLSIPWCGSWGILLAAVACAPQAIEPAADVPPQAITNRLAVTPAVVNNLGISFETASRGRLGTWHAVTGQLEVPESQRWALRSPARARVTRVAARWQRVQRGEELAVLEAPGLLDVQRTIEFAERTLARATADVAAADQRLVESELQLQDVAGYEAASRERFGVLDRLRADGNPLTEGELIAARRDLTEAGRVRLDAAMARDELASRVAAKRLEADQARLAVDTAMSELAVLTGVAAEELTGPDAAPGGWRALRFLTIRAPADGVVVALDVAQGEIVEAGAPVLQVFDTRELRFRGRVPEGDLGTLATGAKVRLEFSSRRLPSIESRLESPLPIADERTRMILVEAIVPNAEGALAHGMSALAQVLVEDSRNEEVLLSARCVVFDGLDAIVFKRDGEDPNVVIRTPVELGARAGGRVEVLAGVLDGDEVVADGVQQLKQTGLGKAPEGGHFHADGTWHKEHK